MTQTDIVNVKQETVIRVRVSSRENLSVCKTQILKTKNYTHLYLHNKVNRSEVTVNTMEKFVHETSGAGVYRQLSKRNSTATAVHRHKDELKVTLYVREFIMIIIINKWLDHFPFFDSIKEKNNKFKLKECENCV